MGNPNSIGSNNHDIGTATEWDSLEKVSRDDLPKMEEAVGSYWPSEEEMRKNETNLNSKTGKERTYSDFDLYSINNYKSAAEQGERRKERNDLITWYELISYDEYRKKYGRDKTSAETNKEYTDLLKSLVEKFPREEEESLADYRKRAKGIVDSVEGTTSSEPLDKQAEYDRIKEKLITAAEEKRMSKSHVERLIANQLDRYVEKRVQESGTKKDTKALIDELLHPEGFEAETEEAKQHLEDETEHQGAKETEVELSPEVQKWLEEELKDVDDWARSHRDFTEEKVKKAKEEVMAKARDKQAALDREQAAAETAEAGEEHQADAEKDKDETDAAAAEAEAAAAAEREKAAAAEAEAAAAAEREQAAAEERETASAEEREQAAAEERAEAEKKEKLIERIRELGEEYDTLRKEVNEKQIAAYQKLIEQVDQTIEQVKKRKRSGLAAVVAAFFARRNRKATKETETPVAKAEKAEAPADSSETKKAVEEEFTKAEAEKLTEEDEIGTFGDFEKKEYRFWSSVGEDGIKYMTEKDPFGDEKLQEVEKWWESLDTKTRKGFLDVKYQVGRPLRLFLIGKGALPPDTGDYLHDTPENAGRARENAQYLTEEYQYWNSIGEEGVRYLIGEEKPNDENADKIMNWWRSLDSVTQEKIFEKDTLSSYRNLINWIRDRLENERMVA